jgi:hypothetical protein
VLPLLGEECGNIGICFFFRKPLNVGIVNPAANFCSPSRVNIILSWLRWCKRMSLGHRHKHIVPQYRTQGIGSSTCTGVVEPLQVEVLVLTSPKVAPFAFIAFRNHEAAVIAE